MGRAQLASHVLAAADGVELAGDEAGVRVGEELHDAGKLVGFAEAPTGILATTLARASCGTAWTISVEM
jgi:hypothetical protein